MTKPRICIALPGTHYASYVPHMLMTQPIIGYLMEDFDITLVFRKTLETPNFGCDYLTVLDEAELSPGERQNRNSYYVPDNLLRALKYTWLLRRFAHRHATEFDLIIERQWPLVGAFSQAFSRYRVPSVINLEAEFYTSSKAKQWSKRFWNWLFKLSLPKLRQHWLRQAKGIVVETDQMTDFLLDHGYTSLNKPITAIPMGVDPTVFYPKSRKQCREQLGIAEDEVMLVYAGSLNRFIQEPGFLIEALGREHPTGVTLHMLGEGSKRKELEELARRFQAPVVFHGRVPQERLALYIGAANLCVAPYNKDLYLDGNFTSASLKVCEYLACGRPVLTIPCSRMYDLLDRGKYGLFVDNEVNAYRSFLRNLPTMQELSQIETVLLEDLRNDRLRAKGIVLTWRDIANRFKQVIHATLAQKKQRVPLQV
jgi:glycosyltransferase involved in cell wall biosynthesis